MANVIYNLENTRFKVRLEEYPDYIFFFSSVFHQNKFLKGYKDFIENENNKFNSKYKLNFNLEDLMLLCWYRKCENRGFRVEYHNIELNDKLEILKFYKGLI